MLPPSLAAQLRRNADQEAIKHTAASTFTGFFSRLADALEDAGVGAEESAALANEVVSGMLSSLSGASDAMVAAVVRTAEAARCAPRH